MFLQLVRVLGSRLNLGPSTLAAACRIDSLRDLSVFAILQGREAGLFLGCCIGKASMSVRSIDTCASSLQATHLY